MTSNYRPAEPQNALEPSVQPGLCQRKEPHECADDVEYCERCGGYRPEPHLCRRAAP